MIDIYEHECYNISILNIWVVFVMSDSRVYGYARVSSKDQNEQRQIDALLECGVNKRDIFIDKASGKDFERENYKLLIEKILRQGDMLIILSIDRLGRNYTDIMEQWKHITNTIKADIKVLDMPLLDTTTQNGDITGKFIADLVLQVLSYVAEKERQDIKKRQAQGIVSAKAQGKHLGRPKAEYPVQWVDIYSKWKTGEITAKMAMDEMNIKRTTFYKLVKQYES